MRCLVVILPLLLALAGCGDSRLAPLATPAQPPATEAPVAEKTLFLVGAAQESASLAAVGFLCLGGYDLNCDRRATVGHVLTVKDDQQAPEETGR